jgi:hypothetical protein
MAADLEAIEHDVRQKLVSLAEEHGLDVKGGAVPTGAAVLLSLWAHCCFGVLVFSGC